MIIVMKHDASGALVDAVKEKLIAMDMRTNISRGTNRIVVGAIGDVQYVDIKVLEALPGVESVVRVAKPHKIVARESHSGDTIVNVGGVEIGGNTVQVIAGPCSVETQEQMDSAAQAVVAAGCRLMRGGAFKPRTSPYSFQGLGVEGLELFQNAARKQGLPIVSELMDVRMLDAFLEHKVDVIQIGTRNMQNFDLLKEVGGIQTPVILKRGMSATIAEWLMSAEYIAARGNHNIIFCERGVRSFETAYRNVLDVTAIPVLKRETHLPVIVDPSHAGGKAWMVPALSRAAVAAGADGLLVEMHPTPAEAWCDADQALSPDELNDLMAELKGIAQVIGRTL
ncbi:MAG: 3-deoxy-7-phosphoheptulonate synthase [Gammaproteobacteria bacterium]|nr:3-deoxy-7-phosphoheptulonate synthase [Gammaproteobacteria bacterium]